MWSLRQAHAVQSERLIELVKGREAIWNTKIRKHRNHHLVGVLWDEIGTEMGCSVLDLKTRFKNLRDTYLKELKKVNSFDSYESRWPYYDALQFLEGTATVRRRGFVLCTPESASASAKEVDTQPSIITREEEMEIISDPLASPPLTCNEESSEASSRCEPVSSGIKKRRIQLEGEGTEMEAGAKSVDEDECNLFCRSLAASLRKMPRKKRSACQVKLMQVITDFVSDDDD